MTAGWIQPRGRPRAWLASATAIMLPFLMSAALAYSPCPHPNPSPLPLNLLLMHPPRLRQSRHRPLGRGGNGGVKIFKLLGLRCCWPS